MLDEYKIADVLIALLDGPGSVRELAGRAFSSWELGTAHTTVSHVITELRRARAVAGPDGDGRYHLADSYRAQALDRLAGKRRPLAVLLPIAEQLQRELEPFAARLEVAGSIRRRMPDVKDIELCALLPTQPSLLPDVPGEPDHAIAAALLQRATFAPKRGEKYTQVVIDAPGAGLVQVDLFMTADPAKWGMLYFIRTGCANFSKRAVEHWTKITRGGHSEGLLLTYPDGTVYPTPEEADVFRALDCPFIPPEGRLPKP